MKKTAIVGAGAAGCFCAIELKRRMPGMQVTVFEAGPRPLAKVAVTGGGRCNFTNSFADIDNLDCAYPRGAQLMKRALKEFSPEDCRAWFKREGVPSVLQDDQCVFPASQDAMQIVRTLEGLMRDLGVQLRCNMKVESVSALKEEYDYVVVTTGGGALSLLDIQDLQIEKPVPSLFTFKIPDEGLRSLMGIVVDEAALSIPGTKFKSHGTLLLTDWGISGPATLKLSSYAARFLAENQYCSEVCINWLGCNPEQAREICQDIIRKNPAKLVSGVHPGRLSDRLWKHILRRAELREDLRCSEMGSKGLNRLANCLTSDAYPIRGRARFKEEFVTCGGVSLKEINLNTLECKRLRGHFLAGEVLDLDAITGGFNLQAAWSTGYLAAKSIASDN